MLIRAFLCDCVRCERTGIHNKGEKAGSQEWDCRQVRPDKSKGSHGTLYFGDRHTVVKDRKMPLKTGTLRGMCKQLGIDPNDL